jgi:hypothetical protein
MFSAAAETNAAQISTGRRWAAGRETDTHSKASAGPAARKGANDARRVRAEQKEQESSPQWPRYLA